MAVAAKGRVDVTRDCPRFSIFGDFSEPFVIQPSGHLFEAYAIGARRLCLRLHCQNCVVQRLRPASETSEALA